ncbi:hypothetical protein [Candidatus Nanohalobium constans]|uniref:Uncharacterized protein n=1 Tax=Candidatus Nanohalobium constans TaxID=2565781 RepID=A0A5Q0UGM0_9ARCH|nr:hypothetical protein [Candidatus Nanohalobium constans]QGA80768.1 hypothetical protein LC1Nh_0885 [Candidatus Nanohalobium constans]
MYDILRDALHENGEIMIRLSSGEDRELHLHNTDFLENGMVKVDGDDEIHWLNPDHVERYWIHEDF